MEFVATVDIGSASDIAVDNMSLTLDMAECNSEYIVFTVRKGNCLHTCTGLVRRMVALRSDTLRSCTSADPHNSSFETNGVKQFHDTYIIY